MAFFRCHINGFLSGVTLPSFIGYRYGKLTRWDRSITSQTVNEKTISSSLTLAYFNAIDSSLSGATDILFNSYDDVVFNKSAWV